MTFSDFADIATIVASVLVVIQLGAGLFAYISQVKRERVIATLEYYESVNKDLKEAKRELRKSIHGKITPEIIKNLESNKEEKVLLHKVLNSYERLAIGLNLGIYDLETLNRINGKILISNYERFRPYIEQRSKTKNQKAWNEFSLLVDNLREVRKSSEDIPDFSSSE